MQATYKDIFKLAFPIIIGSFIQTLIAVTDTAFMGRVGELQLAAIGLISVYFLMVFMVGYSYTKGTQIMIARRVGERKFKAAGLIFDHSLIIILTFALALFIIIQLFGWDILGLLISEKNLQTESWAYLNTRSYGLFFGFAGSVFLAFYMAIDRSIIMLIGISLMTLVNIALNYVLIFGHLGFPALGMRGAAMASNVAEIVAASVFLFFILREGLNTQFYLFKFRRFFWSVARDITKLSTPIVAQTIIGLAAWSIFFTKIESMGTRPLAISNAVKVVYMFFGIPPWGFSAAANTVISNLMGQGRQNEVSKAIKKIIVMSVIFMLVFMLPLAIFPEAFLHVATDNVEIIQAGVPVIYVCIAALMVYSVATILFHGIVSTGTTYVSLLIEIIAIITYMGFVTYIFAQEWNTVPIAWTTEIFYWGMLALGSFIYLKTGRWKTKRI